MRFEICFIIMFIKSTHCITCDEALKISAMKRLQFAKLQTMLPSEIIKCIADLTKYKLTATESQFLWQTIKNHYKGIQYIPPETLMVLHWATPAVSPEEYLNMTLDDIDVIQNFGLDYNLHEAQLTAIADRIRETFANKRPEDYTYYDLTALRNILCAFNKSEIKRIHPSEYKEAAFMIGKLKRCSGEVLAGFAELAPHKDAFGPPVNWDNDVIKILGNVLKYIPKQIMHTRTLGHSTLRYELTVDTNSTDTMMGKK